MPAFEICRWQLSGLNAVSALGQTHQRNSVYPIRKAEMSDAAAISQLASATFTETFGHLYAQNDLQAHLGSACSTDFFANALRNKNCHCIVACDGSKLIGYMLWEPLSLPVDNAPAGSIQIQRLYVLQAYHKNSIGSSLMSFALTALLDAPAIFLGVWEHNLRAQKFYAHYGFSYVDEHVFLVGSHPDRDLILARWQNSDN